MSTKLRIAEMNDDEVPGTRATRCLVSQVSRFADENTCRNNINTSAQLRVA